MKKIFAMLLIVGVIGGIVTGCSSPPAEEGAAPKAAEGTTPPAGGETKTTGG